jgi:phage FluMu protein Com
MRKYKCFDCGHTWQILFAKDIQGIKQACPECKSINVHSKDDKLGWGRNDGWTSLERDEGLQGEQNGDLAAEESTKLINEET